MAARSSRSTTSVTSRRRARSRRRSRCPQPSSSSTGFPLALRSARAPGEAFEGALASDPEAAFGAVIAVNRPVSAELATAMTERKLDVLFAPGYEDGALEVLQRKESLRILEDKERRKSSPGERDVRRVLGGLLVQDRDMELDERETMSVVTEASPIKATVGRPAVCVAGCTFRPVKCDRPCPRPGHGRHRRRTGQPCGCRATRNLEGGGSRR